MHPTAASESSTESSAGSSGVPEGRAIVGLATMEDFIEELIQDEIVDETDAWFYERQETVKPGERSPMHAPVKKEVVQNKGVDLTAHLRKLTGGGGGSWWGPAPAESPMAA